MSERKRPPKYKPSMTLVPCYSCGYGYRSTRKPLHKIEHTDHHICNGCVDNLKLKGHKIEL